MSQGVPTSTLPSTPLEDDWSSVRDPSKRRKIQNRNAQRKFREKLRLQREEAERNAENQRKAGGAYKTPDPAEITHDEPGLPWGSLNFRYVIEAGRAKEQNSRDASLYAAAQRAGGSSRVPGLHLIAEYARGSSEEKKKKGHAWAAWRARMMAPRGMQIAHHQAYSQHLEPVSRRWSPVSDNRHLTGSHNATQH